MSQQPLHIGRRLLLAGILVLLTAVMLWRNQQPQSGELLQLDGLTMGTSWQVQVPQQSVVDPELLHDAIQARLDTLDLDIFSTWENDSELSRFNQAPAPISQTVSAEMAAVTAMAKTVHKQTAGAFDPSIAPLVNLWGFGPNFGNDDIPAAEAISAALEDTGFDAIELDASNPSAAVLHRAIDRQLDYSAIAKGYAADQIGILLDSRSIDNFLVEIGGELLASGYRSGQQEWRIGIEAPQTGRREVLRAIGNGGERLAVAASGNYRNYFEVDGQLYSHEIDPVTGWPVSHALVSVTVLHESAAFADAYATALMVMGPERSKQLATSLALPVYLIMQNDASFDAWYTPAFEAYLRTD